VVPVVVAVCIEPLVLQARLGKVIPEVMQIPTAGLRPVVVVVLEAPEETEAEKSAVTVVPVWHQVSPEHHSPMPGVELELDETGMEQ
jgi:hypothetical protein